MTNAPLLEDTITHIRAYPELHDQSFFFTQTEFGMAACFAGRALLLAGYQPVMSYDFGNKGVMVRDPEAPAFPLSAWATARDLLGLTDDWASNLFSPMNTHEMLERKVKDLLNGAPLNHYWELSASTPDDWKLA